LREEVFWQEKRVAFPEKTFPWPKKRSARQLESIAVWGEVVAK